LSKRKKEEIPKVQLPSGNIADNRTIISTNRLGTNNRVYFDEGVRKTLGLKRDDMIVFLRAGNVFRARPGDVVICRLEDRMVK